jgi:isocitrate lyase
VETISQQAAKLSKTWQTDPRWKDTARTYSAEDVVRLRGTIQEEHTLARHGAERLRKLLVDEDAVTALGALTGNQAVQQVKAGLKAIYLSGWQVAADANLAGQTYPDQSLYPVNSVPQVVRRINNALQRADQITWSESKDGDVHTSPYWLAPIVADAEAGFGGVLNAFELMKSMIAAGAAGVHWEDQLASEKKCGHLGGKVLIPTGQHIRTLNAARLAADVCDVPTVVIARTDAQAATLITSDIDERDQRFVTGTRTAEGYYRVRNGIEPCIARGLAYAPYSDLLWMETSKPDLDVAREFAEGIKNVYPDQMLAFNCSPSFNWRENLDDSTIAKFGKELAAMGYRFQFITLAGFPQPLHVRPGQRLRRRGHARLRQAPGGRVRVGEVRLHRHPPPARGRHRLLRPGDLRDLTQRRDGGPERLHRSRAVPRLTRARDPRSRCPRSRRRARWARLRSGAGGCLVAAGVDGEQAIDGHQVEDALYRAAG